MIEFFTFSWVAHISITFILGLCVMAQSLALMLNGYRGSLTITIPWIIDSLFEVLILCEILIFARLHGQMINGYKNGFIVTSGYEKTRILVFVLVLTLAIVVSILRRKMLPLSLISAAAISLPFMENALGFAFPWIFIVSLIFFLGRSIKTCISSVIIIKTNISSLSIINAVNTLRTGILLCENDGYILISNHQMQNLMIAITGKVFRNALQFYDMLITDKYEFRYEKAKLEDQMVYLLKDGTAWMLTKTDIPFRKKNYVHISFTDVSDLWTLTAKLQLQDQELRKKSRELKKKIASLHILNKKREIEKAKIRAHNILGQRLTVLLRIIQDERDLNHDLLTSLSKGLLAELKAEQNEIGPYEKLKGIQQVFADIGVDIEFEGQLPKDTQQASLFVDIIREGSTNAVRHGFATQININAKQTEDAFNLTIKNNGRTTVNPIIPGGGIELMRKKLQTQGGALDIKHNSPFTLSVVLPGGE